MALHKPWVLLNIRMVFFDFVYLAANLGKKMGDGLVFIGSYAMQKGIAWFGVQFHGCNSGAILATIVLLFHQKVKLIQTIKNCSIVLIEIGKRFSQPYKGEAAFMFYFVAHIGKTQN